MAKVKTQLEYQVVDGWDDMSKQLVEKYPEVFGLIQITDIKAVMITNKDAPDQYSKRWSIKVVKEPIRSDTGYTYCVIIYKDDWESRDDKRKALLIAQVLQAIPSMTEEKGKLKAKNVLDYKLMLMNFGVDYQQSATIPDLIKDDYKWKM